jgi:hypothetical protein
MLKSWKEINGAISNKVYIVDNSTNDETANLLNENEIKFNRMVGGSHFNGVQTMLNNIQTKYLLLVDTDVIFKKDLTDIVNFFIDGKYTIMGEACGDRGGQPLFTRIHPWFCLIDVENVRARKIPFVNMPKIRATGSEQYYGSVPLIGSARNKKYDVGATFLEDIIQSGLRAYNKKLDPEYYFHYEGMSWRGNSGIPQLINAQKENEINYQVDYEKFKDVDIKGWFE